MSKNSVKAVPLTSIDAAILDGSYQPINNNGLPEACFLIRIVNDSDVIVDISYDGITSHDILPDGQSLIINAQANNAPNNHMANFAKGIKVYVFGQAGTGEIYLAGYYQEKP